MKTINFRKILQIFYRICYNIKYNVEDNKLCERYDVKYDRT